MFSKQEIEKYFLAEKQLGLSLVVIGCMAVLLAIIFFFLLKTNFYKGAALSLLVVGLVQLMAGVPVYTKSDERRIRNVYAYDMNPAQLRNDELPRMKTVLKNFAIIKWVEMALVVTGLVLIFYFRTNAVKAFGYGLGITLVIQAMIILFANYSSERRAVLYTKGIENFVTRR